MSIRSPIIVVGSRRSGTTLLRAMLNEHPQLKVHPKEPQFILELNRRYGRSLPDVATAVAHIAAHPYLPDTVDAEELRRRCGQISGNDLRELIHCYLQVWAAGATERPLLKVPAFVFYLDFIYYLFPDMHVVHIVRDPRANVLSQRARWPDKSVWECAAWWRDAVRCGRQWGEREQTPYTELRYEDLVLNPEPTLRFLCTELRITYQPEIRNFELQSNLYNQDAPPRTTTFTGVNPSRVHRWQKQLTPMEIKLIESYVWREMAWWQYKPIEPDVSATAFVFRYARERLEYALLRAGRSIRSNLRKLTRRAAYLFLL